MNNKPDGTPTFNLKAVVQETGLKPDTLRAWERRYGLPQPKRTSGRHRLYSQHDIDILNWLVARQAEGLTISRAVDLYQNLLDEGQEPLTAIPLAPESSIPAPAYVASGSTIGELKQAWIDAGLDFDELGAEAILTQAFALFPPEMVCLGLIRQGIAEIGDAWHRGEVSVQQEHFVSAMAMRRLDTLVAACPPPNRTTRILVATPPDENHTFSPLLLTYLLRRRGLNTIYLGANVPLDRLESTLSQTQPQLVILTAQLLSTASELNDMARYILRFDIPVAYGGLIFTWQPTLQNLIPGYYLGNRIEEAPQNVEEIIASNRPLPVIPPAPEEYFAALEAYHRQVPLIHGRVRELMQPFMEYLPSNSISTVNSHFQKDLTAALKLGDMSLIGSNIDWVVSLSNNRNIPAEALKMYFSAYYQASREFLNGDGQPLLNWLHEQKLRS